MSAEGAGAVMPRRWRVAPTRSAESPRRHRARCAGIAVHASPWLCRNHPDRGLASAPAVIAVETGRPDVAVDGERLLADRRRRRGDVALAPVAGRNPELPP